MEGTPEFQTTLHSLSSGREICARIGASPAHRVQIQHTACDYSHVNYTVATTRQPLFSMCLFFPLFRKSRLRLAREAVKLSSLLSLPLLYKQFQHRPTPALLCCNNNSCQRCKRDNKVPKSLSCENDMDPGEVPVDLRGLTQVEEMLIARGSPVIRVDRLKRGQITSQETSATA